MEFENLIWILILLSPLLGRLLRKKKKPVKKNVPVQTRQIPAERERAPRPTPSRAETPFEEALRQIQEALGESRQEHSARPVPEPAPGERDDRPVPQRTTLLRDKPQKPPVARQPIATYDDVFESPVARHTVTALEPDKAPATRKQPVEVALTTSSEAPRATESVGDRKMIVHIGKDGVSYKEAFVYGEIFGKPRSRNPWRSPD